jgi:hypothetical protein
MNAALYNSLLEACPKSTTTITDDDEALDCFELAKSPQLLALVESKIPAAKYVHIGHLLGDGEVVLNISLYDEDGEHIGGAELTKTAIIWDDDEEAEAEASA